MTPRIDEWRGYTLRINTRDHDPPHVHIVRSDVDLRVYLDDEHEPVIARGLMRDSDIRAVEEFVKSRRSMYLRRWREIEPQS